MHVQKQTNNWKEKLNFSFAKKVVMFNTLSVTLLD